jgi:hypothetical protein
MISSNVFITDKPGLIPAFLLYNSEQFILIAIRILG